MTKKGFPLLQMPRLVRAWMGRSAYEVVAHIERIAQNRLGPRVLFFPSGTISGGSGYLRARGVGRALRRLGWRALVVDSRLTLKQRRRVVSAERPDVIVLQQARHPLNRPSLYPGFPCVFDLDDADILDPRCAADVINCAQESKAVVVGSRYVGELLAPYNSDINVIWTSLDREPVGRVPPQRLRRPVVAWASLSPSAFNREAEMLQTAMINLAKQMPFIFRIYGTRDRWGARDFGWAKEYAAPIRRAGAAVELLPLLTYEQFLHSLESVAVGLQPVCIDDDHSRGRSFGKILGYLYSGAVVVASNTVDHPLFFRNGENGVLVENDPASWTNACVSLLKSPDLRTRLAAAGRTDLHRRLVSSRAAEMIDPVLRRAIGSSLATRSA